jgi:hypothetical protein
MEKTQASDNPIDNENAFTIDRGKLRRAVSRPVRLDTGPIIVTVRALRSVVDGEWSAPRLDPWQPNVAISAGGLATLAAAAAELFTLYAETFGS